MSDMQVGSPTIASYTQALPEASLGISRRFKLLCACSLGCIIYDLRLLNCITSAPGQLVKSKGLRGRPIYF